MKKTFMLGAIGVMFSSNAFASGNPVSVQDNYKNVIVKNPYTVDVFNLFNGISYLSNFIS